MTRFSFLVVAVAHVLLLVACSNTGGSDTDASVDTGPVCPPGVALNKYGLGKPCKTDTECNTCADAANCKPIQQHFFCWGVHDPSRPKMCVKPAFTPDGLGWPSCGAKGRWIALGSSAKPALCVPYSCGDAYHEWPPEVLFDKHFAGGTVNASGLGQHCESMSDCEKYNHKNQDVSSPEPSGWSSFACPMILHDDPAYLDFCSPLCGQDSDCGPNAFCWWHVDVKAPEPQDAYPHAACIPTAACLKPGCPAEPKK